MIAAAGSGHGDNAKVLERDKMSLILQLDCSLNHKLSVYGCTALAQTCFHGRVVLVNEILEKGVSINLCSRNTGHTVLTYYVFLMYSNNNKYQNDKTRPGCLDPALL